MKLSEPFAGYDSLVARGLATLYSPRVYQVIGVQVRLSTESYIARVAYSVSVSSAQDEQNHGCPFCNRLFSIPVFRPHLSVHNTDIDLWAWLRLYHSNV